MEEHWYFKLLVLVALVVFQWQKELSSRIILVIQVTYSSGTGGIPVAHGKGVSQWNNTSISSYKFQ